MYAGKFDIFLPNEPLLKEIDGHLSRISSSLVQTVKTSFLNKYIERARAHIFP
jgi:hypothetical protein